MHTLENIRLFVKVVEAGSFTKAAAAASVTTPQVSRAIATLEAKLGTRLLNRTTRRLAVTEVGKRYMEHCRHILDLVDLAEVEAAGAAVNPSGRLRVHASTGFGRKYLLPRLAHYRERYPDVRIELTLAQRVPNLLDEGQDLAIVAANTLSDSTIVSQQIGTTYCVLCASPRYLHSRGIPRTVRDLGEHACLQLEIPNVLTGAWMFDSPSHELFSPPEPWPFVVNVPDALADAIKAGMGLGPLPIPTALEGLRTGELVRVLPRHRLAGHGIRVLYLSRRHLDAKVKTFIDFVKSVVPPAIEADEMEMENLSGWVEEARAV
ncbi:LysR family transcriptional regulator [Trinickia acidisoli]|uniref:LysR family transcriptional regulator n=1 Tax=Trinickia acidisoli TaxID=2767482 RepID=UPI001A8E61A5|nr:LysR family transcriptional regulator [Trinickia acidisoli]